MTPWKGDRTAFNYPVSFQKVLIHSVQNKALHEWNIYWLKFCYRDLIPGCWLKCFEKGLIWVNYDRVSANLKINHRDLSYCLSVKRTYLHPCLISSHVFFLFLRVSWRIAPVEPWMWRSSRRSMPISSPTVTPPSSLSTSSELLTPTVMGR